LRFVVESSLAGRDDELKESVIGVAVFARPADYDPKADPVVRVSMARLRARLDSYYERDGAPEAIRIVIPKGAYRPVFEDRAPSVAPDVPSPSQPGIAPPVSARRSNLVPLIIGVAAVAAAACSILLFTRSKPPSLDNLHPFITTGIPNNVSFAPDGETLIFDMEAPGTVHRNVYFQALRQATATRITNDTVSALAPAWSPDGSQVAYLKDLAPDSFGVFLANPANRTEKQLTQLRKGSTPWLSWSPDGRWLAAAEPDAQGNRRVVLISTSGGQHRALTHPAPGSRGDSLPVFSRDGKVIAFRRTTALSGVEDIYTVPASGGPETRLTFDGRGIDGFTFLKDGSLLFSSKRTGPIRGVWWLSPRRSAPLRVTPVTLDAGPVAASRDERHFALVSYDFDVNIWRIDPKRVTSPLPLIASELPDSSPQFSPDGTRLSFSSMRAGTDSLWVARSDGDSPKLLVDGAAFTIGNQHWSPDSKRIVFEWHRGKHAGIFTIPATGGTPVALVTDEHNNSMPSWSHDGAWVYFLSDRSGHSRIWRMPASGGAPSPVTTSDAEAFQISPSGDAIFYMDKKAEHAPHNIWKLPLPSGDPELLISGLNQADWCNWAPAPGALYFLRRQGSQLWEIDRYDLASRSTSTVYELQRPPAYGGGLAISPDGNSLLFTQVDREGSRVFVQ
jgi:Tol biopolymer transport system component